MDNVIIILVLLGIVSVASWYVIRSKKSGKKCIGCPDGCCADCCGCNKESE